MLPTLLMMSSLGWSQRLLHLGNSYTFYNSLDQNVSLLLSAGGTPWEAARLSAGGLTFADHLGRTAEKGSDWHAALADGSQDWDWVILQEQSQIPGFPETSSYVQDSVAAAVSLDDLAEARGAETVFMMTWGRRSGDSQNTSRYPDFSTMQGHLTDGYIRYRDATATDKRPTWIAPVGLAFAHVHDAQEDPLDPEGLFWSLYTDDGSHPSPKGTYLAACVIYVTLTGEPSAGLPSPDSIDKDARLALQQAADAAVFQSVSLLDYPWSEDSSKPKDTAAPDDTSAPNDTDSPSDSATPDASDEAAKTDEIGCSRSGAAVFLLGAGLLAWRRQRP